jgi:tetratricopeptide (TPR) repeat protein
VALGDVAKAAEYFRAIVDGPHAELSKRITRLSAAPYVLAGAWLAGAHSMRGDLDRALVYGDRAVQAADASDSPYAQAIAYTWRIIPIAHRGAFSDALPLCVQAVELCEKRGLLGWVPFAYSLWGWVLAWTGRPIEGAEYVERAVTLFESVGIKAFLALRYVEWAEALLLAENLERAQATATRAFELAVMQGERANESWAWRVLGDIALAAPRGDHEGARAHYEKGRELAQHLGLLPLLARCHLGLGLVHARVSDIARARAAFHAARDFYRTMGSDFWLARAEEQLKVL